ncbi:MAG: hypothetical protein JXO72_01600 [Vicinamibacteria bacterium]|nr:hypothetical protein [Vicinamibacteria bacterium]
MNFIKYSALSCGFCAASLAVLLLADALNERDRSAVILGGVVATVNAILAYLFVLLASRRSARAFMGFVLGGMIGRMAFMLAAVFLAIVRLGFPRVPLAVSLLSYFTLYLVFELAVLHQRAKGSEALS